MRLDTVEAAKPRSNRCASKATMSSRVMADSRSMSREMRKSWYFCRSAS